MRPYSSFCKALCICSLTAFAAPVLGDSNGADVTPCEADLNGDGIVDGADLGQLLLNFFKECEPGDCNCCSGGDGVGCNDDDCEATVCGVDPFCCDVAWDGICNGEAADLCTCCPDVCASATGDCCTANGGLGCNQPECCASVCAADPFCCETAWDGICADEAAADPNCDCKGAGPCDTATGDCCSANGGVGCNDPACCASVCALDPFCCDVAWDGICADEAAADPNCDCGGGLSNCCFGHEGGGCDDPECEAAVCACDSFCCTGTWDDICAGEGLIGGCGAAILCDKLCPDVTCSCQEPVGIGCPKNPGCEACVCGKDPFCCDVAWDSICVGEAEFDCTDACCG